MQLNIGDLKQIKESDPELYNELIRKLADEAVLTAESPYVKDMFPPQRAFFADKSKRKAALCSRRAGKTFGLLCWLLEGARDCPKGLSVYIALSRNSARLILWATAVMMNEKYKLGLWFRERDNQLIIQTDNGHQIWLAGAKDKAEIEKFRGIKLRRAAIDEAASFPEYIRDLVFDVLDPCLMDLNGEIALIGTPGVVPAGLFFEITTGQGFGKDSATKWSCHEWTVLDNPHIPHAEEWLATKRKENRWDMTHPRYVREWLGRWVQDDTSLVFPFDPKKNSYIHLPQGDEKWMYAIGIDVGYEDETAFVVGAYRRNHPEIYIVEVIKESHLIPSALAVKLLKLQEKHGASQLVMDCGGMGKAYAEECSQRYGMYIEPAEKTKKRAFVEIVRGELISGVVRLNPRTCEPLIQEMQRLCFNEDMSDYDDVHDDHACDAFLYLVRSLMPYYRPYVVEEPMTHAELVMKQQTDARKDAIRQVRKELKRKMKHGNVIADIAMGN